MKVEIRITRTAVETITWSGDPSDLDLEENATAQEMAEALKEMEEDEQQLDIDNAKFTVTTEVI